MKIQFYTHRPDPLLYAARLLDKALGRPEVRAWLYGGPGRATELASRLNKARPEAVWPLLRAADWPQMPQDEARAVLAHSRLLLLDDLPGDTLPAWPPVDPAHSVPTSAPLLTLWINLAWDDARPEAAQAVLEVCARRGVQRLLDIVGEAPASLSAARQRWRVYRDAGHEIEHLVKETAA